VFEALASLPAARSWPTSATDLTAGEIAARFSMTKPAISKHLSILENAGLIRGEKRGQFIHYALVGENVSAPHTMRIEPALYWLPLANWTTDQDERRVLRHYQMLAQLVAGNG